jgi:hypothetical protein
MVDRRTFARALMAVLFATALVAWTSVAVGGPPWVFAVAMSLCAWSLAGVTYVQAGSAKGRAASSVFVTVVAMFITIVLVASLSKR